MAVGFAYWTNHPGDMAVCEKDVRKNCGDFAQEEEDLELQGIIILVG